jgi:hypothetical protein
MCLAEAENRMAASSTTLTLTRIRLNMVEYIFNLINKVKYSILHIENQDMHIRGTITTVSALVNVNGILIRHTSMYPLS